MQKEIFNDFGKVKPFVKWAGGKSQLLNDIINTIPKGFIKNDFDYVEPFVGGGAVLFKLMSQFDTKINKATINDINSVLIKTYKVIKSSPNELIAYLKELNLDYFSFELDEDRKNIFYEKRKLYNSITNPTLEKAALFIFLNRTCFNGLYRENSRGEFNVPFGRYKNPKIVNEKLIFAIHKVLQKVDILEVDFAETINNINADKVLFYLDPPYRPISKTSSFASYTKEVFDDTEQKRLKTFCDVINSKEYNFILSNSDPKNIDKSDTFFEDLYSGYKIIKVRARRNINAKSERRGHINELLITNF